MDQEIGGIKDEASWCVMKMAQAESKANLCSIPTSSLSGFTTTGKFLRLLEHQYPYGRRKNCAGSFWAMSVLRIRGPEEVAAEASPAPLGMR